MSNLATRVIAACVCGFMVLFGLIVGLGLVITVGVRDNTTASLENQKLLLDCLTPGPTHACYQDSKDTRATNLAEIRRSIDCVIALSAHLTPPQCDDVRGRIVAMAGGVDLFAPPTTRSSP